jgi:hypothetical protein
MFWFIARLRKLQLHLRFTSSIFVCSRSYLSQTISLLNLYFRSREEEEHWSMLREEAVDILSLASPLNVTYFLSQEGSASNTFTTSCEQVNISTQWLGNMKW